MPAPEKPDLRTTTPLWIVEAAVESGVALTTGEVLARDDFHAWLWEAAAGLLGIDEGSVTAADAAAHGLVPPGMVIDAVAAPADRDWVARLAVAREAWWFHDEATARAATTLVRGASGCHIVAIRSDTPVDHEAMARASFGPIAVPGFGVVRPSWEDGDAGVTPEGAATIYIEPGLGFGTGLHETTQLCLAALAGRRRCGGRCDHVLDYGSGSGILAIAAAVLGAGRVDAVEIDDRVHDAITANARRNGVAARVRVARHLPADAAGYDVVVANIVAPVLVDHAAALCARLHPRGGTVVLSGLFAADVPGVADRYAALLGCRPVVRELGEWRSLSFERD